MAGIQRTVQTHSGSYVVTIPTKIVHSLGLEKGQYVEFAVVNGKIVIKPTTSKITARDLSEADKGSGDTKPVKSEQPAERPAYEAELDASLKKKKDNRSRLEKLKMK